MVPRVPLGPFVPLIFSAALLSAAQERVHPIRAVDHGDVVLTDGFWRDRLEVNRTASIPRILQRIESAGAVDGSEVYKAIEAASYSLKRTPDADLSAGVDRLIERVAPAQEPDGYLYEAAVAHFEATGNRTLLDAALKNANLAATLGPGKLRALPGHEEIALALIRLFRATGVPRYYAAARSLLDQRGGQETVYLHTAMADVAGLEGDKAYLAAVERVWRDTISTRIDITGGIESPGTGAHKETCASAGNVFWNARLFWTTGNSAYLDVLERTLYNALLTEAACDPANLARTIAQMPVYMYAYEGETIFVNLYGGSRARVPLINGAVTVTQTTNYPWDGEVRITVEPAAPRRFIVAFRNPGWTAERPLESDVYRYADGSRLPPPAVEVNGERFIDIRGRSGFITVMREWKAGDEIRVRLQMPVRRIVSHPGVKENAGKHAFERGPLVYAAEAVDNGGAVLDLVVPPDARLESSFRRNLLGGVRVVTGQAMRGGRRTSFTAVPYFAGANRGPGEMAVWIKH